MIDTYNKLIMQKRLSRNHNNLGVSESQLRHIIYEELVHRHLVNEGLWDDTVNGVKKLSAYVTKQFKSVAVSWAKTITNKLSKLTTIPEDVKVVFGALKQAMQESGETFKMDETLLLAKELGSLGADGALLIVQQDLEGPVKERAKDADVKQEGCYLPEIYSVLVDHSFIDTSKEKLNEDFGVSAIAGIGLAIMGGLPLLFKGLYKLAIVMGALNTAELFKKAEHITHKFEQKVIDFAVPDKLSYALYKALAVKGVNLSKQGSLSLEEFQIDADKSGAMKKTQGLIYKTILIYFAIQGLAGVLKAGASLLGFVEGTATSVKGIELARGAQEVMKLVKTAA